MKRLKKLIQRLYVLVFDYVLYLLLVKSCSVRLKDTNTFTSDSFKGFSLGFHGDLNGILLGFHEGFI